MSAPQEPAGIVLDGAATSGMTLSLHPLPILNISDHYNRSRFASASTSKHIGALLGTETDRNVSIVNSFELIRGDGDSDDVDMSAASQASQKQSRYQLNEDFLQRRRDQCKSSRLFSSVTRLMTGVVKETFPALDLVGWYSVGSEPTQEDLALHAQFSSLVQTPVFLLFNPHVAPQSQDIPVTAFESALTDTSNEDGPSGRFVRLSYSIETGEAERIAVDGVSRGGMGSDGQENIANLTTQRNAIRMLYDRLNVLFRYVNGVVEGSASPNHEILRQISGLLTSVPVMNTRDFETEFAKEYEDVTLTAHLMSMIKQVNALSDFSEKHAQLYPPISDEFSSEPAFGPTGISGPRSIPRGNGGARRRRG